MGQSKWWNNRFKFKTLGKLPIILEESVEYGSVLKNLESSTNSQNMQK